MLAHTSQAGKQATRPIMRYRSVRWKGLTSSWASCNVLADGRRQASTGKHSQSHHLILNSVTRYSTVLLCSSWLHKIQLQYFEHCRVLHKRAQLSYNYASVDSQGVQMRGAHFRTHCNSAVTAESRAKQSKGRHQPTVWKEAALATKRAI